MSYEYLKDLPGSLAERGWVRERLDMLSEKEKILLSAALERHPPQNISEAADHLLSLSEHWLCSPAGDHKQLGLYYLRHDEEMPEDAIPYVSEAALEKLGIEYGQKHPGMFTEGHYVIFPEKGAMTHDHTLPPEAVDLGWSVRVKLASPVKPDGVWLCLPDHGNYHTDLPDEYYFAKRALGIDEIYEFGNCEMLDARCVLPEAGNLMEQYDDPYELIRNGDDLGFILEERGQGMPHYMEHLAAALEYEGCHTLRFALDIAQNLSCYEYIHHDQLAELAQKHLRSRKIDETLISPEHFNLEGYAEELLESRGYMLTNNEQGYIMRNDSEFHYEYSDPPQEYGIEMK